MNRVLSAEFAVFFHLETIRVIFLVFDSVVVSLFAFVTSECDFYTHIGTSLILPPCISSGRIKI